MRLAILAHDRFPDRAKTAIGVLRYADHDVVAVIDRATAGDRVTDHVPDLPDAPIVESMAAAIELAGGDTRRGRDPVPDDVGIDALLIGVAPIGGGFEESWRPDVRTALETGCDLISGLHAFLAEDEEFARLATENDADIWDVRRPPADLTVSEGVADQVDADVVLTVGTDCSVGKMTATMELVEAACEAGHDAVAIPTGQTGIVIEGWGIPVDRVISDFTAGAVERMIRETGDDHDLLIVEGQGSITHPAYSAVTCGILHGAMADRLVLCHAAGRETVGGYESFSLPPVERTVELYESLAEPVRPAPVVAGALNTKGMDEVAASTAIEEFGAAIDAPATDPVREDAAALLPAVVGA